MVEVHALTEAVTTGRDGKGTVYVFASGNEIVSSTNYEGWSFTRFTIAVGAVGKQGHHSSYSTAGAALLVCAPGGDHEYSVNHVVAKPGGACGNVGVGTSYAAPVVSGVVALMLEAAPGLTWRDVQGVLVHTSKKTDPDDSSWATNGAGLNHSYKYGFGLVDAHAAVTQATSWVNYSPERFLASASTDIDLVLPGDGTVTATNAIVTGAGVGLTVEHIYVYLDLDHSSRGDLHIELVSPASTRSVLVPGLRPAPWAGVQRTVVTHADRRRTAVSAPRGATMRMTGCATPPYIACATTLTASARTRRRSTDGPQSWDTALPR